MKEISFANYMGEIGKISTEYNKGDAIKKKEKKVRVIDCDPQAVITNK